MQIPERFQVARSTVLVDRLMNQLIRGGGIFVVLAVFGIFVFIGWQILPLFRGATVKAPVLLTTQISPSNRVRAMGMDEWARAPFLVDDQGHFHFHQIVGEGKSRTLKNLEMPPPPLPEGFRIERVRYRAEGQTVAFAGFDGRVALVPMEFSRDGEGERFTVLPRWGSASMLEMSATRAPILDLTLGGDKDAQIVSTLLKGPKGPEVWVRSVKTTRGLGGDDQTVTGPALNATPLLVGTPRIILIKKQGDGLLTVSSNGVVQYLLVHEEELKEHQRWTPFEKSTDPTVTTAEFIFGDVSVSLTSAAGEHVVYSLYAQAERENQRYFGRTKTFPPVKGGATFADHSIRNKTLLIGGPSEISLRYSTTEDVRWHGSVPAPLVLARIAPRNDAILAVTEDHRLAVFDMNDKHPEVSFKAFFGKLWYEGSDRPKFEWQSTGGTDDFEPKLSLIPLIIGTLKGTFYALLFAVPIALLAALYASQFLHPTMKGVVKPAMEIMASLPSVVLGFLAALFIAPLIETKVPSLLMILFLVPLAALLFGNFWASLPTVTRARIKPGFEFLAFAPIFLAVTVLAWNLGPWVERLLFTVKDAQGTPVADFRLWFTHVSGLTFDQRNSLVVGFIMGFAVMPILFTIADDALSNVPSSLRSGALALGASRWQTAIHVVLPTAAAGIFSAVMVAFGRAVGETMIVVMATGNTAVMDFNIFSGMRTLSANIAVELPEAPEGGTLYRTLFLGAMVLFLFTFLLNTLAEILRQRLREKYKNV